MGCMCNLPIKKIWNLTLYVTGVMVIRTHPFQQNIYIYIYGEPVQTNVVRRPGPASSKVTHLQLDPNLSTCCNGR